MDLFFLDDDSERFLKLMVRRGGGARGRGQATLSLLFLREKTWSFPEARQGRRPQISRSMSVKGLLIQFSLCDGRVYG